MYIVKRGKLQVCGEDDGRGNIPVFATLAEGAVFGELSILNIAGLSPIDTQVAAFSR